MKTRIIIDSTADITPEIKEQLTVVPLTINFGNDEYIDGVTINHKEFYEKLIESDVLPTTSQVSPFTFGEYFKDVADAGDCAVVITLSSKLSGTYQSAVIAADDYPDNIFVVDSLTVSIGSGILAELALNLAKDGMSAKDIAERLTKEREKIQLIALVDTLEYLHKGGRLSKTAAIAGGLLSLKPVICVTDGEVKVLGKARGSKQGNNLLVRMIEETGGVDFEKPFMLGYTGLTDVILQKYITDSEYLWKASSSELSSTVIGSVVGTHVGPGAIAAAFFCK